MKNKWSCLFLAGFLAVGIVFTGCNNQTSGGSTTAAAQESGTTAASATTESVSAVTTSAAVETSVSVAEPDKMHNLHHEEDHYTLYHCSFYYGNCKYECYLDTSSGEVTDCHHIDEEEGRHHAESEHESAHSHESHHSDHHDE